MGSFVGKASFANLTFHANDVYSYLFDTENKSAVHACDCLGLTIQSDFFCVGHLLPALLACQQLLFGQHWSHSRQVKTWNSASVSANFWPCPEPNVSPIGSGYAPFSLVAVAANKKCHIPLVTCCGYARKFAFAYILALKYKPAAQCSGAPKAPLSHFIAWATSHNPKFFKAHQSDWSLRAHATLHHWPLKVPLAPFSSMSTTPAHWIAWCHEYSPSVRDCLGPVCNMIFDDFKQSGELLQLVQCHMADLAVHLSRFIQMHLYMHTYMHA